MAKSRGYNFLRVILTLFVCLLPTLGAVLGEKAVIYASVCVLSATILKDVYDSGKIIVTKTATVFLALSVCSYLGLLYVSDKGSHFAFSSLMLLCCIVSLLAPRMRETENDKGGESLTGIIYASSVCYAVAALFSQIFVQSTFWSCRMDLGNDSPTAAAFVALSGIGAALKIFKGKRKTAVFLCATALLTYVFVMTKSLGAFLAGAILVFLYTMSGKRKRTEAFFALVLTVLLAIANILYGIYAFVAGKVNFNATLYSFSSMVGVGKGGYEAYAGIVGGEYKVAQSVIDALCEAYGIFGIIFAVGAVAMLALRVNRTRSFKDVYILIAFSVLLFSSQSALFFVLPMLALCLGYDSAGEEIKLHPLCGALAIVPMCFFALLASSRLFFALGHNAEDLEQYSSAQGYYVTGAKMEMFSSEGWEKAYGALEKDFRENGTDNFAGRENCIKNAIKYNKKNYSYRRLLADVYTSGGRYSDALAVWDELILKNDNELLYAEYARKIRDVMKNESISREQMKALYEKIGFYADKCEDMKNKIKVNDVLTESQKYYILARDGDYDGADMYAFDTELYNEENTDMGAEE